MNKTGYISKRRGFSLLNPLKRKNQISKQKQYPYGTKELLLTQDMVFSNKIQEVTDSEPQTTISPSNTDVFDQLLNYDKQHRQVQNVIKDKIIKLKRNKSSETLTSTQLRDEFDYPPIDFNSMVLDTSITRVGSINESALMEQASMLKSSAVNDENQIVLTEINNDIAEILEEKNKQILISPDLIPDLEINDMQWPDDDFSKILSEIQYNKIVSDNCIDFLIEKLKEESYEKLCDKYLWRIQQQRIKNYAMKTEIYQQQQFEALNRYNSNYLIINTLLPHIGYLNLSIVTFYTNFYIYIGEAPVNTQIGTFYEYVDKLNVKNVFNFGNAAGDLQFYPQNCEEFNNYICMHKGVVINKEKCDVIQEQLIKNSIELRLESKVVDLNIYQCLSYQINSIIPYENMLKLCKVLHEADFNICGCIFLSSKGLHRPSTFLICYLIYICQINGKKTDYKEVLILMEKLCTQRSCVCFNSAELVEYVFKFQQYIKRFQ